MTKIIITIIILYITISTDNIYAQIVIGKEDVTNNSVLLEFGNEEKGIVLPSVASAPGAAEGTFIYNTTSNSVQVLEGVNWKDLTDEGEGVPHSFSNYGADVGEGVIIGAHTSLKPGVLVLESTEKAMVLPHVTNPHLTITGAIAGTLVYDTVSGMLAVFDGANWSYWK